MLFAFGRSSLDTDGYRLVVDQTPVEVEPRVLELLACLIEQRERVVSKEELLDRLWPGLSVSESSLTRVVSLARRAIGDDRTRQDLIRTVYGRGYAFVGEVAELPAPRERDRAGSASDSRVEPSFVGRGEELSKLSEALGEALCSRGRLVSLVGEAGIGKTRTAEQVAQGCREQGIRVLLGRCREESEAPAFWPWTQVLRAALEAEPGLRGSLSEELAPLLPGLRAAATAPASQASPEQRRFRLLDQLAHFLLELARRQPTLVVLDDVHRADLASLEFLSFVAPELRDVPLVILLVFRDGDASLDGARAQQLSALARETGATWLRLGGLSHAEVAIFLEAELGQPPAPELAQALHELTDGNPFFLTQLLPLVPRDEEGPRFDPARLLGDLPASVREAVRRQLQGLPPATHEALELAAVVGREFSLDLLAPLLEVESGALLATLEPALERRVVVEHPELPRHFRFVHALVQEVVHDSQPRRVRASRHLQVAQALEAAATGVREEQLSELAHHYREAAILGHDAKAFEYAKRAGEWAAERYAYGDAVAWLTNALRLLGPGQRGSLEECDLTLALAQAQTRSNDRVGARETFRSAAGMARRLGVSERHAEAALGVSPGALLIEGGVYDHFLVELLEDALAGLPDEKHVLRARLLTRLALARQWGEEEDWLDQADEGLAIAERTGDPRTALSVKCCWLAVNWGTATLERKLPMAAELIRGALDLGDLEAAAVGTIFRVSSLLSQGRMIEADQAVASFTSLVAPLGQAQFSWYELLFQGIFALHRGKFDKAETIAMRFAAVGRRALDQNAVHSAALHLLLIRWEQGRIEELLDGVRGLVDRYPLVMGWRAASAWVALEAGRPEEAREQTELLLERGFLQRTRKADWLIGALFMAEVSAAIGHQRAASLLYPRLLALSDSVAIAGVCICSWGAIARPLGLLAWSLGRLPEAEAHLRYAVAVNDRVGASPWRARSQFDLARMLTQRCEPGDVEEARKLVGEAMEAARAAGMEQLSRQLVELGEDLALPNASDRSQVAGARRDLNVENIS